MRRTATVISYPPRSFVIKIIRLRLISGPACWGGGGTGGQPPPRSLAASSEVLIDPPTEDTSEDRSEDTGHRYPLHNTLRSGDERTFSDRETCQPPIALAHTSLLLRPRLLDQERGLRGTGCLFPCDLFQRG